jgi:cytochrome c
VRKTHLMVLAIVVVAVVLAVGAVSAYADITTDSEVPVTTTNAVAHYWNTAAITATATDNEGIAYIYNRIDGGPVRLKIVTATPAPTSAEVAIPVAKDLPLSAGSHTLKYWAQDINGNVEIQHSVDFTVATDTAKPVTAATGATDGAWYKAGVTVHLAAADGAGESGVKELTYALDGAAPAAAAATADVAVPASAGTHTIAYHATDVAGNAEAEKTFTVNVDTSKPMTSASAASVVKGRKATLKYRIADVAPNAGTATVVIKIKNRSGKVVTTIKAGSKAVNTALSAKFTCKLAKGTYKYYVYATDVAGNAQSKAGSAKLTVK